MKNLNKLRERSLLQILFDDNKISAEQFDLIHEEYAAASETILDTILKCQYVSERDVAKSLVNHYQLPFIYPEDYVPNPDVQGLLAPPYIHTNQICPIDIFGNVLVMVTSGNISEELVLDIETTTEKEVYLYVAQHSALLKVINDVYSLDELVSEVSSRMDELFGSSD